MEELDRSLAITNTQEKIGALGDFMGIGTDGGMDEQQRIIFDKAKFALLSIPGHAKYYQGRIERLRAQALVDAKRSDAEIMQMRTDHTMVEFGNYESFRENAFQVLGLLPSGETVAVLSHFLDDPEGMDGKRLSGDKRWGSDLMPFPTNGEASVIALSKLGIEGAPIQAAGNRDFSDWGRVPEGDIDAWKRWWNEIKDGKRTFRFIGSSVEYGPDGPVAEKKSPKSGSDRKRDAVRSPQVTNSLKPLSIAGILAACCLCVAAVWYYLRSRRMKGP